MTPIASPEDSRPIAVPFAPITTRVLASSIVGILACGECNNCLCYACFESYDTKNAESKTKMKCPFCNSTKSIFSDY